MIFGAVLLACIMVCAILLLMIANSMVSLRNNAFSKFAQLDMQLRYRQSLIDNFIESLDKQEPTYQLINTPSFQEVIKLQKLSEIMQLDELHKPSAVKHLLEFTHIQNRLSKALTQLFDEISYNPQLALDDLFDNTMQEMSTINKDIVYSAYKYNLAVYAYNSEVSKQLNSFCASILDLKPLQLLGIVNDKVNDPTEAELNNKPKQQDNQPDDFVVPIYG